jgi:aminopeptidase N
MDPRNPFVNLRRASEPGLALAGDLDGCPHDFDVLHYDLTFTNVQVSNQNLTGHALVQLESKVQGLASIALDFKPNLVVSSVLQGVTPLAFTHVGDVLTITLASPAALGQVVSVDIAYSGTPWHEPGNGFGGFWFYSVPNTAFSMGVGLVADPPSMGRTWFPCYDRPCDKATIDLHVTTPLTHMAIGNGALADVDTTGGTHTWSWSHDYPTSTYLMAMSVAQYRVYPDSNDTRITYYHHPGYREASKVSFQFVDQMMAAFEQRFGPYPYEKFAYMTAPKGDMEHQTCVTHLLALVDSTNNYDDILSHELMHQWFGDCVTYGTWKDVWLSEGFATYGEAVWREAKSGTAAYHSYVTQQIINRVINSGETDGVYDPSNLWGAITYEKGACVLHMLRGVLDDDTLFFQVLSDYMNNHLYDNAVSSDFVDDVSATVGEDMSWFFDPWLYGDGHPLYEYGWSFDPIGGGQFRVDVIIRQKQTEGTLFDMPVDFRVLTTGGPVNFTVRIDQAEETAHLQVPAMPIGLLVDPDDWILDEQQLAPTSADYTADAAARQSLQLEVPRPNPFGTRAEIRYYLPEAGPVSVRVFDVAGRLVRTLHEDATSAGSRSVHWDRRTDGGDKVASGTYWIRLDAMGSTRTRSVVVVD